MLGRGSPLLLAMVRRGAVARAALAMVVEARNMVAGYVMESCRLRAARTSPSRAIYFLPEASTSLPFGHVYGTEI